MKARALRRSVLTGLAALVVAGLPSLANAAVVAYIEGGEVWVATLDGTKKKQFSTGEGDWQFVAASDTGRIAAVRNIPGNISNTSTFRVWEANGALAYNGALTKTGSYQTYVYPLSFDISSDGVFLVYGYYATNVFPTPSAEGGYYARSVNNLSLDPIAITGQNYPTLFGRRAITMSGTNVRVQDDESSAPFGTNFTGWFSISFGMNPPWDVRRTDVAATGTLAATDYWRFGPDQGTIDVWSISGFAALPSAACTLPTATLARDASLAPDAQSIAWRDSEGVKAGTAPSTASEPCGLASVKVISATGTSPSIGGADPAVVFPAPQPPASPQPQPTPPPAAATPPPPSNITVPSVPKVAVPGLSSAGGTLLSVSVPATGSVTCTATVPAARLGKKGKPIVVAGCAAVNAAKAGAVTLRLKFNAAGRKAKKRLKGAKLTIRITQGAKTITKVVTIK